VTKESFDVRPFEALLREAIGLDPDAIGRDEIARAIALRGHLTGIERPDAYLARVAADEDERLELTELLVVGETWFFREPSAFTVLSRAARSTSARARPLRVLSAPCSTGEEPYSIAIALHQAGRTPADAVIRGADISRRAIERARRGVYAPHALRHLDGAIKAMYFVEGEGEYRVRDDIRRWVTYARVNLVEPDAFAGAAGPYDVIFCRNVLIYLDAAARDRTLSTLATLLARDGLLFTGHAEGSRLVAPRFVPAGIRGAFAFRHAATLEESERHRAASPVGGSPRDASRRGIAMADAGDGPDRTPSSDGGRRTAADALAAVEELADTGRLAEARARCQALLDQQPALAHAHYLLGVIEHGRGRRADAEAAWRRAIYLDPRHEAALGHLAIERERQGDTAEAARLRRRMRSARSGAESDTA
jgi:chemotaxis protein methyltransferase WspC